MYVDRVPPHDEKAEEAVLGSILVEGEAILRVAPILRPDDFYRERNRWAFEACLAIFQRGEAINQVSVSHELTIQGRLEAAGGASFLSHLVATVPTSVHAEHYGRIVGRSATMRNLIHAATEIAALGYEQDADIEATLRQAEDMLLHIRSRRETRDFVSLREVLDQYMEDSAADQTSTDQRGGPIPTGFLDLDQILGTGLQRADLIILAARPSLGKSTLAIDIARNAARNGATIGIFSLEMSREQLAYRMLSAEAEVDSHRLRLNMITDKQHEQVINAVGALSDHRIFMDDSPFQTIVEIRSKARRLHMEQGLDLCIVDYIQLIQVAGRGDNRVQEMSEISRSLKGLARDLNVPVLAISQLSRAVEQRPSHRPQLSDLRDSGSIEQDADVVAFIYRDDMYYSEEEWERLHPTENYPKNLAELIVAKHRNGPLGTLSLYFRSQYARFENFATRETV